MHLWSILKDYGDHTGNGYWRCIWFVISIIPQDSALAEIKQTHIIIVSL